ncbi:MAG: TonB-dependent hemoglobin/transferrin/lactoferrin family receptor [Alphaproteobacteria bacterium]
MVRIKKRLLLTGFILSIGTCGFPALAQTVGQNPASTLMVSPPVSASGSVPTAKKNLLAQTSTYPEMAMQVETSQAETHAVSEPESATPLHAVTVTATKTERSVDEIPANVTVIGREEINDRNPQKLDDLLHDQPGVDMSGGPRRLGQDVSIRGMGNQRVIVTLDGARQNFEAGHKGRVFLDPDILKQVDVVRGSNSALHGSGAIGGVIAMETKDASDFLDPGETMGFRTKYGYSTAASEPFYSAGAFGRYEDKLDLLANISFRYPKDIHLGTGDSLQNSEEDIREALFKATARPDDHQKIGITLMDSNEKGRVPINVDTNETGLTQIVDRETRQRVIAGTYNLADPDQSLVDLTLKIYRNEIDVDEIRASKDRRHDETLLQTTGFDLYNTSRVSMWDTGHTLTYGVEYFHDIGEGRRNGLYRPQFPDAIDDVAGVYLQDEVAIFQNLTVTPAIRYDHYQSERSANFSSKQPLERETGAASPRVGVNWRAHEWLGLWASYGWGFRAPTLLESYVSGQHFPGNNFIPNPDLKPEHTETAETGMRFSVPNVAWQGDHFYARGTYFYTKAEDFIEEFVTATTSGMRNIPNATISGVEAEMGYDMPYAFSGLSYARIRGDNEDLNQEIDSIPADKLIVKAGFLWPKEGIRIGIKSEFAADQDRVSDTGTPTSGYGVHGVFLNWAPPQPMLEGLRVDLGVENILDTAYRRHLTPLYEEGRDYRMAISYTRGF